MGKFMKNCAITALVMLVLGIVLVVAAGMVKGTGAMSEAVERISGGRVHLGLDSMETFGFWIGDRVQDGMDGLGDLEFELGDVSIFDNDYRVMNGDVSRYALGTDIRSLEIEVGGCTLTVKESEDDTFYVEAENVTKFQGYVEGDTLHIKAVNKHGVTVNDIDRRSITLYVPADYRYDSVEVSLGAGVMHCADLYAEKVELEIGAGQFLAEGVEARELAMEVGAGEIVLENINVQEMQGEAGMGNLELSGSIGRKADLECGMGNITLELSGKEGDYNYQIDAAMGNVDIGSNSYSGLAQERRVNNGASTDLELECAMGNISITFLP